MAVLARTLFAGHVVLIVFSTIALTTFLAGPPPAWLAEEPNATALRLGWKYSGPVYVVLGALAALAHATARLGVRRALLMAVTAVSISLGAELLGTRTGLPFGPYEYTPLLGYRIAGLVPFPIPISWFYMIYGSLAICSRLVRVGDGRNGRMAMAMGAGLVLTAWDVAMDPAMVATRHWIWYTDGFFYGMPLSNWLGWFVTGTVIARLILAITPPSALVEDVGPTRLPIWLYLVNGVMPVAICVREAMWWAALLGAAAMVVPAALALARRRERAGSPGGAVRSPGPSAVVDDAPGRVRARGAVSEQS